MKKNAYVISEDAYRRWHGIDTNSVPATERGTTLENVRIQCRRLDAGRSGGLSTGRSRRLDTGRGRGLSTGRSRRLDTGRG